MGADGGDRLRIDRPPGGAASWSTISCGCDDDEGKTWYPRKPGAAVPMNGRSDYQQVAADSANAAVSTLGRWCAAPFVLLLCGSAPVVAADLPVTSKAQATAGRSSCSACRGTGGPTRRWWRSWWQRTPCLVVGNKGGHWSLLEGRHGGAPGRGDPRRTGQSQACQQVPEF